MDRISLAAFVAIAGHVVPVWNFPCLLLLSRSLRVTKTTPGLS
jgi:hypothetical protein